MNIQPLGNRVLVEPLLQELKSDAGIYLPENTKELPQQGKIIKVGKIELSLKKGDSVYFTKYSPIELKIDGRTYLIIKEEDILAICE